MSEVVTVEPPRASPADMIAAAADLSTLDRLQRLSEDAMRRLEETGKPFRGTQRVALRRALAVLRAQ